jgi:hypothetical protein
LRVGKLKATGAHTAHSVDAHLSRSRPTPNADPTKSRLNRILIGSADQPLGDAIAAVMTKAGIDRGRLRKDAVLANDIMLSISPAWFRPQDPERHGHYDTERLESFEAAANAFLRETFGGRVVKAVLHLDEATPHIHAVVVPILAKFDKDGQKIGHRLSGKDMFNPRGLAALQQRWEDQLTPYGVGARTKGSKARHTTLREFYGAVDAFESDRVVQPIEISAPPAKSLLESPAAYKERVDQWRRDEAKRLRAERMPLEVEASRGRLYQAERRANDALRGDVGAVASEAGRLREALADADIAIERDKDEISRLRATPINDVAAVLGYAGEIARKENAIDLVMRVGQLNYRESLAWLAQRFDPETAATAAREYVAQHLPEITATPVLTKGEKVKTRLVSAQLDALAAPAYRVTVMQEIDGRKVGRNLGKRKDGPEKFYTKAEVVGLIPQLTAANVRGGNIFLTPIDAAAWHVLADDLTARGLDDLTDRGYAPAIVMETSPGNYQAVLKIPKTGGSEAAANAWFRDLNRDLGDQRITGLTHPFRLAAYENRKEKHRGRDGRFPFVRLAEATNRFCGKALAVVRAYAQQLQAELVVIRQNRPAGPRKR